MDARAGLIFLLFLGINWASDARTLGSSDLSGLKKAGEKLDVCTLCEEYVSLVLDYLDDNETQTEVIEILHMACSVTQPLEEECITLVDRYVTLFFLELSSIQADEACEKVNLCQSTGIFSVAVKEDKCDICHQAVAEILLKLKDPDAKLEIIEILLKGCDALESYAKKCKAMVFEYGPIILTDAEEFLQKTDICAALHACSLSIINTDTDIDTDEVLSEGKMLMVTSS